jgi:hypothetical protein
VDRQLTAHDGFNYLTDRQIQHLHTPVFAMGTSQDRVSKLEHGDDALVSTLRRPIRALGGELRLTFEFPDRPSMAIDLHGDKPVAKSVRAIGSV